MMIVLHYNSDLMILGDSDNSHKYSSTLFTKRLRKSKDYRNDPVKLYTAPYCCVRIVYNLTVGENLTSCNYKLIRVDWYQIFQEQIKSRSVD